MTVCIVSRGIPKGKDITGIFEYDQAKALKKVGIDVIFISLDIRSFRHKRSYGLNMYNRDGIMIYDYSIPVGRNFYFLQKIVRVVMLRRVLKEILNRNDVSVIHSHFAPLADVVNSSISNLEIKHVLTEHNSTLTSAVIPKKLIRRFTKIYSKCDTVISVSNQLQEVLAEEFNSKSIYVPNIIDTSIFEFHSRDTDKVTTFEFVTVGNLIKRKRFDTLIKCLSKLNSKQRVLLTIIGEGEEKENLEEIARLHKVDRQITFTGKLPREEIFEYFKRANTFILLSSSETFGVVYVEAMSTGLPVIATKCGGPEGFVNELNGLLVEVDNETEIVEAMKKMINDYTKFNQREISDFVDNNYSVEKVAINIKDIYEKNIPS